MSLVFALFGGQNPGDSGSWSLRQDTWNGEGICSVGPPPDGLYLPDRNLAKAWCDIQGLESLGYAMAPQESVAGRGVGVVQNFDNVILIRDAQGAANGLVYVLFRETGTYQRMAY